MYQVDIIIPCYNPKNDWEQRLISEAENLQSADKKLKVNWILVNDGSPNDISDALAELHHHLPNIEFINLKQNRGKGYALRQGVEASRSKFTLFTDIDIPYGANGILDVLKPLLDDTADISLGTRNLDYYQKIPTQRSRISKLLKSINRICFRLPTNDTQCGIKGFNTIGRSVFLKTTTNRFLIDLEFLLLASKDNNIRFIKVPVQLAEGIELTSVKLSILKDELGSFIKILIKALFF